MTKRFICRGSGGGQVVCMLAFYSDDPSSYPADVYIFSVKFVFEKIGYTQKETRDGPFEKEVHF